MDESSYHSRGAYYGRPLAPNPSANTSADITPNRGGTPNTDRIANPFNDAASTRQNPFASPSVSRPGSSYTSSNGGYGNSHEGQRFFHSRRIPKGVESEKPWLGKRDSKEKWVTIFPILGIIAGLGISAFLVWDGVNSVVKHNYCHVLDEDFSGGLDSSVWSKEVEVGGFGNGEFCQTTGGDENVFVQNGVLTLRATLQDEDKVEKDTLVDLLKDGTCTSKRPSACIAATNTTAGNASIVPPTKSGRINTKKGASIKYGRVEVTAKLPKGDWLWPAIWMLPVKDTYGTWPASGEIDIMESRGNNYTYAQGGNNIISSALHWGPDPANDAWWRTNNKNKILRGSYSDDFNTFGLEWSQKYLFTYVNSRLLQVMYTDFKKPMWQRGDFSPVALNESRVENSWHQTGNSNTPFDQEFYLILNLAVGGTNGWFEDGRSGKPWMNESPNARKDFWHARDQWLETWESPQLEVKRVVMMQQCDGNEEL